MYPVPPSGNSYSPLRSFPDIRPILLLVLFFFSSFFFLQYQYQYSYHNYNHPYYPIILHPYYIIIIIIIIFMIVTIFVSVFYQFYSRSISISINKANQRSGLHRCCIVTEKSLDFLWPWSFCHQPWWTCEKRWLQCECSVSTKTTILRKIYYNSINVHVIIRHCQMRETIVVISALNNRNLTKCWETVV